MALSTQQFMGLAEALETGIANAGIPLITTAQRLLIMASLAEWVEAQETVRFTEVTKDLSAKYPLIEAHVPVECPYDFKKVHGPHDIDTTTGPIWCPGRRA